MSSATSTSSRFPPSSAPAVLSSPHCPRTCTSRIGLVDDLLIHRTEAGESVPGAPTYTRRTQLNCPHCPRTFKHRMSPLDQMRLHENLRQITAGYTTALDLSSSTSAPHLIIPNTTKNMLSVCIAD
ncbi:unnamed protein product [Schistocephalus solidus]|uniref:C2H2-type domain-containing protein n=1 Tax=Schistocephalus solidus TaxID=70667 RepID=A0A183SH36_SCHSO|nr:unnamed protein product [Schistocephalus solidus]